MRNALARLEADAWGFWTDFGNRPGGEVGKESGARWFRSGISAVNFNGINGLSDDIGALIERVRSWQLPARWLVSSATAPPTFEKKLEVRGLTMFDEWPGMAIPICELRMPAESTLTVEAVRDDPGYKLFADVFRDAYDLVPEAAKNMYEAHFAHHKGRDRRVYLLMRHQGDAIATGILHFTPGVAGIYGIGVRKSFQKRGMGALATLLTIREGARRGAELAVLQASPQGFPVYQKLGFQTLTSFRSWRIT